MAVGGRDLRGKSGEVGAREAMWRGSGQKYNFLMRGGREGGLRDQFSVSPGTLSCALHGKFTAHLR